MRVLVTPIRGAGGVYNHPVNALNTASNATVLACRADVGAHLWLSEARSLVYPAPRPLRRVPAPGPPGPFHAVILGREE